MSEDLVAFVFVTINTLILLANLRVLSMVIKLYTEILKDKAQDRRAGK